MDRSDKKITLCKIKFNMGANSYHKKKLSLLVKQLEIYFINAFGKKLKLRSFVNVWMVEDLETVTCGIFQIYFYENLFNPDKNSSIHGETKLKKTTVEKLLNELFSLEDVENEQKMEAYVDEIVVKIHE